ncbi:MAG: ATP-binding protein [Bacteroidales bacterium]|nr:ATP-binding protein [Bacteroidales bacterium]
MIQRLLDKDKLLEDSTFLFGARQTGKSTLLLELFPDAHFYDLLESNTFERLQRNPSLLRQDLEMCEPDTLVIIDEVQSLPILLNEVQWLMVRKGLRFILSGSSARKLKRGGANMLGGRALQTNLYPMTSVEVPDFDIVRAVNQGMIPRHYLADSRKYWQMLQAYVAVYLREEIKAEALVRNLSTFTRFLEAAALTNGEMVNFSNIAQDCGVDSKTVAGYFSILEETLIGYMIPAFSKTVKRKLRQAPRFYYFDVAVTNYLLGRRSMVPGSADFGHAFEHFVIQEIIAYLGYHRMTNALSYWHTYNGYEVDAILGDAQVAIEIKSADEVQSRHLHGLKAFKEEHPQARLIAVSLDTNPRRTNNVEVWPVKAFLEQLWAGKVF